MPYNPYFSQYSAFQNPQTQPQYVPNMQGAQQPVHGFVYVTGMEGARAYPLPPNSDMPLFDSKEDVLYIKTTDGAGFPTVRRVELPNMLNEERANESGDYVTHDELERALADMRSMIGGANGPASKATGPSHLADVAD